MKKIIIELKGKKLLILILAVLFQSHAYGKCSLGEGAKTATIEFQFPDLVIQRDAPVGSILASKRATVATHTGAVGIGMDDPLIICDKGHFLKYGDSHFSTVNYNGEAMLDSGIPGVSIRLKPYSGSALLQWSYPPETIIAFSGKLTTRSYGGLDIEIVKTAPTTGNGNIKSGMMVRASAYDQYYLFNYRMIGSKVTTVACSVTTPSVQVQFGKIPKNKFTGVGSSPISKEFNITLNCDSFARVNLSMDGIKNTDVSDGSVLALTGQGNDGIASGIGVQLTYNETPIELNKETSLKDSGGGLENFKFKAKYYQTKSKVTAGKANAIATFNITYQ